MREVFVMRDGKLVPKSGAAPLDSAFHVMQDITEFQSPIDGSLIASRSQLREHERRFGVRQCGELKKAGDYSLTKPYDPVIKAPER